MAGRLATLIQGAAVKFTVFSKDDLVVSHITADSRPEAERILASNVRDKWADAGVRIGHSLVNSEYIAEILGSLGDVSYPEYDGGFVFIHSQTGKPELEYVETPPETRDDFDCVACRGVPEDECDCTYSDDPTFEDCPCHGESRCIACKGTGNNLALRWTIYRMPVEADTRYESRLASIAKYVDRTLAEMKADLQSSNPMLVAQVICDIASHESWENFDSEPLKLSYAEVKERYRAFDHKTPRKIGA